MRFIFLSLIVLCLSPLILNADSCTIETTKDKDISSFGDCKGFSVSSDSKTCCYVSGVDANFNEISACQELTASEKGAAVDLNDVEMENTFKRKYYLEADCNFGKKTALCDPDDRKSDTPLSANICQNYVYVSVLGIEDDMKCCYVTGKNLQDKDVYSCIGIEEDLYPISDRKNEIETGKYKRLGVLKDINIDCKLSSSSFLSGFLFILLVLYSLLL